MLEFTNLYNKHGKTNNQKSSKLKEKDIKKTLTHSCIRVMLSEVTPFFWTEGC